jgi:lipopolysaccharide/colanic/teichoic acid biosynthesis glycosyltransferase
MISELNTMIFYYIPKRLTDLLISIFGLILLFPLIVIVAILIKVTSKGPIFFKGLRTGKSGKIFFIYKFRSMYLGSEILAGSTSRNDSRITTTGKFIRKYKIDEIPQLINVFLGEMSLVGPRPELPKYTDKYSLAELKILTVKPGITDISSIKFSNLNDLIDDDNPDICFEKNILNEKNLLRIQYVNSKSYFFDLKLIFLTIKKIIFGK